MRSVVSRGCESQGHRSRSKVTAEMCVLHGYLLRHSMGTDRQPYLKWRHQLWASAARRAAWRGWDQRQRRCPARVGVVTRSNWPRSQIKGSFYFSVYVYSAVPKGNIVMIVCVSLCLHAYLRNHVFKLRLCCNTSCISGFLNDVMFAHNGQATRRGVCPKTWHMNNFISILVNDFLVRETVHLLIE